jgi:aldehyde dehydrogenase (NAD+)
MPLEPLRPETRLLVDGKLVPARDGRTFENVNPATEEVLGPCADASRDDVLHAVAAARRAFDETGWSTDAALRARCLRQLAEALSAEREQLRSIVVHEAGAPVSSTRMMHVDYYLDGFGYWADLAERYEYERPLPDISFLGQPQRRLLRREATGVVGAITPWNVPVYLNLCKLGPALAAGNTVVLKPAPDTPWSATHIGKLVAERTDVPPGVVNVVSSSEHRVGEILASDPRVDCVTFTGSTATGRRVMELASATVKRVFLELGGKSAFIVLDDAKLEAALAAIGTVCIHGGQGCAITTRLLLPRARYEEGLEVVRAAFERWPYGDPTDPRNLQGPQISRRQQERVIAYVEKGRQEGARVVLGGGRPAHLPRGFYVEPTVLADVDPRATVAQEEIFGPVLCVIPHDGDDDAVRIANDSIYGLSGAVASASEERALAVARRVRTGTMSVNGGQWFHVDTPFGGVRQSGLGRENGVQGFEEYLETKVVALPARRPKEAS